MHSETPPDFDGTSLVSLAIMITAIEELSLNAWPSLLTMLYDGWVMRFANGYTRRANSINPLYPSTLEVDQKICFCEEMYQSSQLPVVFKITPKVHPGKLDGRLRANGYLKDALTSVQVMELNSVSGQTSREAHLLESLSAEWLDDFCRMSAVTSSQRKTLKQILSNITPRHCFVSLEAYDQVVACGMGVLQSGYIGLFDIVTDPAFRNRGYGRRVVKNILAWGRQNNAGKAYLQVMLNNPAALHLYSKIGFVEEYQYWYRVKP
jgi:ribosomal protein S18 acetylase RimI-like enzyme